MKQLKPNATPPEYSTLCPYLMVDDLDGEIQFLERVFKAQVKEKIHDDQGEFMHGEVIIGEVVVMLGKGRDEWPSRQSMNYVFVEDADTTFKRAIKEGALPLMEPGNREYGLREGGFEDPQKNQWWVAHPLSN